MIDPDKDVGDRRRDDEGAGEQALIDQELGRLHAQVTAAEHERFALRLEIDRLNARLRQIKTAPSYKLAAPMRAIERLVASLRKRGLTGNLGRVSAYLRGESPTRAAPPPVNADDLHYRAWIEANDRLTDADRAAIAARIVAFPRRPLISVLMPVRDPPERFLVAAIESLRAQLYREWELRAVDDGSRDPRVREVLADYARRDPRVKVASRAESGGIAAASNLALAEARGEFLALLDHDDELAPHALYLVADAILGRPDLNIIYSDQDVIDENGARRAPYFKPDWNPDLLLGQNCVSHLGCYRAEAARSVGGFREGFEGSQDWDLALRVAARSRPDQIRHLPFALYHWRRIDDGANFSSRNLAVAAVSARRAVRDFLRSRGDDGCLVTSLGLSSYLRVQWPLPTPAPLVSVIVPTRDRGDLLRRCVDGLRLRTDYPNIEILVVDNGSTDKPTLRYLADLETAGVARVIRHPGPFNFSTINNHAAAAARGEILLLLNNDVEPIDSGWLKEMASQAVRPEIGVVGALLRYPDGGVQHAGVMVRPDGVLLPHRRYPRVSHGHLGRLALAQNFSAVTGACMALRKAVFDQVGGFNPDLPINYNDVDLCLRIAAAGYRVLWTPFAELLHLESATRGRDDALGRRELARLHAAWGPGLDEDPFHNPNLAADSDVFAPANLSRVKRPWR